MGILDRMMARGLTSPDLDSTSTTLAQADSPVVSRIRTVMSYFTESMSKNRGQSAKVSFILTKLLSDALDEASEVPPEILEFYMGQASATLYWAATGETILNMPLPDDFPVPTALELSAADPEVPPTLTAVPALGELE